MDLPLNAKSVNHLLFEHLRKLSVVLLLNEPGVDFEGGNFLFVPKLSDKSISVL
jgi:hypothetical protein